MIRRTPPQSQLRSHRLAVVGVIAEVAVVEVVGVTEVAEAVEEAVVAPRLQIADAQTRGKQIAKAHAASG